MEAAKRISIVMCTYNGEKFLREQLDSIVAQTYPIFELLIQDDGSTDSTAEIIGEYTARYPYIDWKVNPRNLGFNANFRTAIQRARGELIAISDQDDVWHANKLEEMVKRIGDHSMCYSFSVPSDNEDITDRIRKFNDNNTLERLLFANAISGHNMLVRKSLIDHLTDWDDTILYDWWLAANAHLHDGVCRCEQVLTFHRLHSGSAMKSYHAAKAKAYLPYLEGYVSFRHLQKNKSWQFFYQHLYHHSRERNQLATANHIVEVMLKTDIFSFITLCFLSMKYREVLMPRQGVNRFRAFFYPCFYAHHNTCFECKAPRKPTQQPL